MSLSALEQVLAKYDWAKHCISDLEASIDEFREADPPIIRTEIDDRAQVMHYVIDRVPPIPIRLCFLLGDAVHNLRSTLDHLAYALLLATDQIPHKHAAFPISDKSEGYPEFAAKRLPGVGPKCRELLLRLQPYNGGFGHDLWVLHQMDIIDKHRLLLAVCTRKVGRTMLPSEKEAFRNLFIGPHAFAAMQYVSRAQTTSGAPLEAGSVLGTFPFSDEFRSIGFAFDVAINEPAVIAGRPIALLLGEISSQVDRVIENFSECL